jgi:hypothetical protein
MDQEGNRTAAVEGSPGDPGTSRGAQPVAPSRAAGSAGGDAATAAVYRTPSGWRVGDEELPDLLSAMILADLLVGERPSAQRPADPDGGPDAEIGRLKRTIIQLEHALASRVRVEQAIGVLTERYRLPPREAFDLLRTAARGRGRRVHDLADEVVANVTNPLLPVASELARLPRAPHSRGRRPS